MPDSDAEAIIARAEREGRELTWDDVQAVVDEFYQNVTWHN